jgi:hypothetical protein
VKICSTPQIVTGVAVSAPIPADTRSNPINIFGSIVDSGASTYTIQYTTSDVFAAGYNPATDPQWTTVPSAPTTGSKPFNITALGLTAIRLNVTVNAGTVAIGPVFQSDSTVGA